MKHYLTPNWPAPHNIRAYTTLRFGGHSKPPFDDFNLSIKEPTNLDETLKNRALLRRELNLKEDPVWINQTHGTHAIHADEHKNITPEADASYTQTPNTVCVILTADCLPVLVCNKKASEVAAIHAGWKGLHAGVIEATIEKLNTSPQDCLIWLGPAIGPNAFEVDSDVKQMFVSKDKHTEKAFVSIGDDKWLGDLYMIAKQTLNNLGVHQIYGGDHCTYTERDKFYSFRRERITGRMASLIWIKEH